MADDDRDGASIPTGVIGMVQRAIGLVVWLVRRPFIAPQWVWALITVVAVAGVVVTLVIGIAAAVAGALGVVGVLGAAVWAQWWLLGRGDKPVVLLSPYTSATTAAREAAGTQLRSLHRFLTTDTNIRDAGGVVVRQIAVPIRGGDARRLLQLRTVVLVIRGEAEAGGGASYFRGEAYYREDGPTITLNRHELSVYVDGPRRSRVRTFLAGDTVAAAEHEEGDLDLRRFVAASVRVEHFKSVAKVLLVLLAEVALKHPHRLRQEGILVLPCPNDAALSEALQTRTFQLEAELRRREEPRSVVEDLDQRAHDDGIGGAQTATWLVSQWYAGEPEGWTTRDDTLAAAKRWSARFPGDAGLQVNLAASLLRAGELDEATSKLRKARALGLPDTVHERYLGNIAWARKDAAGALMHYRRAAKRSDVLGWQIAECYIALGQPRRALRAARQALRHDPFRTQAAEIGRQVHGWPMLLQAFPPSWRGLLWRVLHRAPKAITPVLAAWRWWQPEDPFVAVWIGRAALLRGDIHRADQWLTYAGRFAGTSRVIATLDMVVVMALTDDRFVEEAVDFAAEHLTWLEDRGVSARAEAAFAMAQLFEKIRYLDRQPEETQQRVVALTMVAVGLSSDESAVSDDDGPIHAGDQDDR